MAIRWHVENCKLIIAAKYRNRQYTVRGLALKHSKLIYFSFAVPHCSAFVHPIGFRTHTRRQCQRFIFIRGKVERKSRENFWFAKRKLRQSVYAVRVCKRMNSISGSRASTAMRNQNNNNRKIRNFLKQQIFRTEHHKCSASLPLHSLPCSR